MLTISSSVQIWSNISLDENSELQLVGVSSNVTTANFINQGTFANADIAPLFTLIVNILVFASDNTTLTLLSSLVLIGGDVLSDLT